MLLSKLRNWLDAEPNVTFTPLCGGGVSAALGAGVRTVDSPKEDGDSEALLLSIFIWITF
jgi:hypothetical protein